MSSSIREPLSARQSEIAGMVARGRTSPEIAKTLFLSPRTVENHVAAIFNKLGVGSRAELISALWSSSTGTGVPADLATRVTRTNLPSQRTSLIGRDGETAEIVRLFENGRLITVTGAGGIGKTRTALAVGETLLGRMPAGVWLVQLAPLASGSFVAAAIAQALDIAESPKRALLDALLAHVKQKRMLPLRLRRFSARAGEPNRRSRCPPRARGSIVPHRSTAGAATVSSRTRPS